MTPCGDNESPKGLRVPSSITLNQIDDVLIAAQLAISRSPEKPAQRERHVELNLASQNLILNGYVRYADS